MKKILFFFYPLFSRCSTLIFRRAPGELTYIQFMKHAIVGGGGAVINYVLFNVLVWMRINIIIANTITNIVIIATTFIGQKYFTYQIRSNATTQFALFIIQSILYYLLDTTIVYFFINILTISPLISKLISIVTLMPLSFLFNKYVIFKTRNSE